MNREEYTQLCQYVSMLQDAIEVYKSTGEPEKIYNTAATVVALYGDVIPKLTESLEDMKDHSGLAERSAIVMLALLKSYQISDEGGASFFNQKMDNTFIIHASEILADTKNGLTGAQIIEYCNGYAIDFNVEIPVNDSDFGKFGSKIPNKRTALLLNLRAFNMKQQFQIIYELCNLEAFENNGNVKKLKEQLYTRYGYLAEESISNTELAVKTQHWLSNFPDALNEYNTALAKYDSGIFERNTLDDMRLSFELLVKALLHNGKSLENQNGEIGSMLKNARVSIELRNMVPQIIKYYTDFQNNHVKHNDLVNSNEMEYVIEQTSIIMKLLIKINDKNADH